MRVRSFSILILLLALTACQVLNLGQEEPEPGAVLFQDDFSQPTSGWNRGATTEGETDYAGGFYRIYINQAYTDIWSGPGLDFSDVRIEVEAAKASGPDDNHFGVICRAVDSSHFYFFLISSDGYYGIGRRSGEQQDLLGMDGMQPSEAIRQGEETNHIRADCVGDRLTLYVNGTKLAEVQDPVYTHGDVGLIAGSFASSGTDIHFDHFTVLEPASRDEQEG
ncbi:MAG: hypothetical protein GX495_12255 [Chloroflexi bacterium]|jgi:hypothetical protein|nr:hypothetical protein [Chloroflexota bacterium]